MTDGLMQPEDLMQRVDEQGRHLCTAHAKATGEPCNAPAILGGTVCRMHGGSAPQTRDAARRRLAEAADPAAARLILESETAKNSSDRIRAAVEVLDRAGVPRQTEEEVARLDADRIRLIADMLTKALARSGLTREQQRRVLEQLVDLVEEVGEDEW